MHTPGPWHRNIKPASHYPTVFSGRSKHVCTVAQSQDDEMEGNVNLIVAAPELLEALKMAEDFMTGFEGDDMQEDIDFKLHKIRASIAKAEGK